MQSRCAPSTGGCAGWRAFARAFARVRVRVRVRVFDLRM